MTKTTICAMCNQEALPGEVLCRYCLDEQLAQCPYREASFRDDLIDDEFTDWHENDLTGEW